MDSQKQNSYFFKIYSEFYDLKLKKSKKDFIKIDFLKN